MRVSGRSMHDQAHSCILHPLDRLLELFARDLHVDLRRRDVRVAQVVPDRDQVRPVLREPGPAAVSERVGVEVGENLADRAGVLGQGARRSSGIWATPRW